MNQQQTHISASRKSTSKTSDSRSHVTSQVLLDVDDLSVSLGGQKIISGISFCVHAGEFVGLIGPNGAGKTTLLRAILGLLQPTSGSVHMQQKSIGYIPQRGYMHDSVVPLSVLEVVRLGAGVSLERGRQVLAFVGMEASERKRFASLSGGQQQRVLIARAIASQPTLLVLDEPTTGIDERSEANFYELLLNLQSDGMAIIMVSHDIDLVLEKVDRVVCLNGGLLYDGPPDQFEAEAHMADFYAAKHRVLHHKHGGSDV